MTNYEWLVRRGDLGEFIDDLIAEYHTIEPINKKYGLELKVDQHNHSRVSHWLRAEHKEPTKWVRLEDVLNIVKIPIDIDPNVYQLGLDIEDKFNVYREQLKTKIGKLETKEIEDE